MNALGLVVPRFASLFRNKAMAKALRKTNYPQRPYGGFDPLVKQLFDALDERRVSNTSLSEVTGIDHKTLSNLRRGVFNPSLTTLQRIVKALGYKIILETN